MQIYLIEKGFSDEATAVFLSTMRAVQTAMILLTMHVATRARRAAPPCAAVFPAAIPFCLFLLLARKAAPLPLYLLGSPFYVAIGAYCIFSYRLPYTALRLEDYGRISGISGAISAALTLAASLAVSLLQAVFPYDEIMRVVLLLSAAVAALGFFATLTLRERLPDTPKPPSARVRLLGYRHFTALLIPNLLRGLTAGVMGIAVTLGYARGILDARSATLAVVVTGGATMLGSLLYSLLPKRTAPVRPLLFATVAAALTLPLLLLGGAPLFFTALCLITVSTAVEDIAVPVAVVKLVDGDMIARYTGGRMLLHTLGTALGGFIAMPLFHAIGPLGLMLSTAAAHLAFGIFYYFYFNKAHV